MAAAASCGSTKNFGWLACLAVERVLTPLITVVVSLAMLYFLWGLTKYLTKTGDSTAQAEARGAMWYGLLTMFVMFSLWGLVQVLVNTFELDNSALPVPKISLAERTSLW